MKISDRVKRNIFLYLTMMGCGITAARITDPVMRGAINAREWFDIAGAVVLTFLAWKSFRSYNVKVRRRSSDKEHINC